VGSICYLCTHVLSLVKIEALVIFVCEEGTS